jgi:hypothetical protein
MEVNHGPQKSSWQTTGSPPPFPGVPLAGQPIACGPTSTATAGTVTEQEAQKQGTQIGVPAGSTADQAQLPFVNQDEGG